MKIKVFLEIEEENERMAYQLLGCAVKEKFKNQIKPLDEQEFKKLSGGYPWTQKERK